MKVVGFAGYSGSGKTTLVEAVISLLVAGGETVGVVKHAHHRFDVDQPGKDSWRHRKAGAREVLVASDTRLALMREYAQRHEPSAHALIAELDAGLDWVLVEGFRGSDLPKIEVWRAPAADFLGHPAHYPDDRQVRAVCTDRPDRLPVATDLPVLDWCSPSEVVAWMRRQAALFIYPTPGNHS
ncbi:molybdopterin-guanine dinucleotide biosynthesis protein B [Xylophilus sp. Kf1]|nr:molybdopterin-guanine dinucleotide biosynthesis protein B [Xylophilus sp. Kf1]